MYDAFWRHALFVRGQSFAVKFLTDHAEAARELGWGRDAPSPLECLPLVRRSFLRPQLPSSCYTGCKKLRERNLRNLSLSFVLVR